MIDPHRKKRIGGALSDYFLRHSTDALIALGSGIVATLATKKLSTLKQIGVAAAAVLVAFLISCKVSDEVHSVHSRPRPTANGNVIASPSVVNSPTGDAHVEGNCNSVTTGNGNVNEQTCGVSPKSSTKTRREK